MSRSTVGRSQGLIIPSARARPVPTSKDLPIPSMVPRVRSGSGPTPSGGYVAPTPSPAYPSSYTPGYTPGYPSGYTPNHSAGATSKGLPIPTMRPRPQTSRGLAVSRFFSATPTSNGLPIGSMRARPATSMGLPIESMVPRVPLNNGLPILSMMPRAENIALARTMMQVDDLVAATNRVSGAMTNAAGKIDTGRDWGILGDIAGGIGTGLEWTGNAAVDAGGFAMQATIGTDQLSKAPGALWATTKYFALPKSPIQAILSPISHVNYNLGDPFDVAGKADRFSKVGLAGAVMQEFGVPRTSRFGKVLGHLDVVTPFVGDFKQSAVAHDFAYKRTSFQDYALTTGGTALSYGALMAKQLKKPALIYDLGMLSLEIDRALGGSGELEFYWPWDERAFERQFGMRARGGRVGHGEISLVGERGPEIVRLPAAQQRSREPLGAPGAGASARQRARRDMHIHQQLDGREIARSTVRSLDDDEQWGRR